MHKFNIIVTPWGSRYWVASLKKTVQVRSKLFKKPQPYHGTSIRGEGKVGWAYYRHLSCIARRDTLHQGLRHQLLQTHLVELYAQHQPFNHRWSPFTLQSTHLNQWPFIPHQAAVSASRRGPVTWPQTELTVRPSFFLSFFLIYNLKVSHLGTNQRRVLKLKTRGRQ